MRSSALSFFLASSILFKLLMIRVGSSWRLMLSFCYFFIRLNMFSSHLNRFTVTQTWLRKKDHFHFRVPSWFWQCWASFPLLGQLYKGVYFEVNDLVASEVVDVAIIVNVLHFDGHVVVIEKTVSSDCLRGDVLRLGCWTMRESCWSCLVLISL